MWLSLFYWNIIFWHNPQYTDACVPCWHKSFTLASGMSNYQSSTAVLLCYKCVFSRFKISVSWHINCLLACGCLPTQIHYTGCNRRNGPDFGRVFLRSNYTDITQNTYIQSWTVTEILAREKSGLLLCLRTVLVSVTSFSPLLELHSYVRANVAPAI